MTTLSISMTLVAIPVAAYVLGSIPFGLILAELFGGGDVRKAGSGNIGATNVARVAGKKLGAVVLLLDALKGAAPVLAARFLVEGQWWHAAVAIAAVLGHVFPVWLKFKGGKGVATAGGALAVLLPYSAAAGFAVWALVMLVMRVSSVGSLLGAAVAVGFLVYRPIEYPELAVVFLLLMLFTHRSNLKRLINRQEIKV